ncbi:hypothetical protein QBZ16_000332 [Prototheca wickerhamii]|uniref:SAC3/GANP/THP3 conserved domain-containing protein n=1 Tax=Prototheca wickerhamii TaxID=3111 RepID=A0AAD9IKY6_PROWI|nr:hypothetical protein QBZ16_000332 [Prototheca wickerhamii]
MLHLRSLLDRTDARFGLIHKFLWDRYRAVRQDLYVQGMHDEFAISVYEEIVRFHIMCEHELCDQDQSVVDMEGFNSHLNIEQMNKALISLSDMYERQTEAGSPCQTEAEFRAYHLLSLMAQHGKFKGDGQAFLSTLQALRPEVKSSAPVRWVLKLQQAFAANDWIKFFALVDAAPYLLACLAHIYFNQVRGRALVALSETLTPSAARPALVAVSQIQAAAARRREEQERQAAAEAAQRRAAQAEAARRAAAAEAVRQREAEEAARLAAERRRAEEAARQAAEAEAARQRAIAEEAARQERERRRAEAARRAAAEAEAARQRALAEEEARRVAAAKAAAEARRLAAEAEARRRAAEAEARRLAAEVEARRIAEEKERRRQAKCRAAILALHFGKWRRRLARAREVRAAQKRCSVGIFRSMVSAVVPGMLAWASSRLGGGKGGAEIRLGARLEDAVPTSALAWFQTPSVEQRGGPRASPPAPPGWEIAADPSRPPRLWRVRVLEHARASVPARLAVRRALGAGAKAVPGPDGGEAFVLGAPDGPLRILVQFAKLSDEASDACLSEEVDGFLVLAPSEGTRDQQLWAGLPATLGDAAATPPATHRAPDPPAPARPAAQIFGAPESEPSSSPSTTRRPRKPSRALAPGSRTASRTASGRTRRRWSRRPLGALLAGTLQRLLVAHGVAPEDGAVDAALGRRLIDQTLVHAAEIVLAAEASPAAQRRWPPRELVAPGSKLAGWWDRPRQQTLIASLAAVRARQGALLRQELTTTSLVALSTILSLEDRPDLFVIAPYDLPQLWEDSASPSRPQTPTDPLPEPSRKRKLSPSAVQVAEPVRRRDSILSRASELEDEIRNESLRFQLLTTSSIV